jgi:hypothetical protein
MQRLSNRRFRVDGCWVLWLAVLGVDSMQLNAGTPQRPFTKVFADAHFILTRLFSTFNFAPDFLDKNCDWMVFGLIGWRFSTSN